MGDTQDIEGSPTAYEAMNIADLYTALSTSKDGLTAEEATRRRHEYGPNEITEVAGTPLILKFLANFYHLFAIMLWIGGILAFVGGMPELGWAIFAVIFINAVFSFWQEFRAEKATEALKRLIPQLARVVRGGAVMEIGAPEIVPGDVLVLEEGDNVPADARLIEEFDLRVNQATLNGESQPARRTSTPVTQTFSSPTEVPNLVFAGTSVAYGRGRAVVYATGMNTQFGTIARLTQSLKPDLSPLQREMGKVTQLVAILATGLGIAFFILGYFVAGLTIVEGFLFSVGIIVANVPEGLLPTVTLSLAMGVQRMADRHALVKKLSAVETLGSTTVICTDKTGTLTQNEMTVRNLYVPGADIEVSGVGYAPQGELSQDDRPLSAEDAERARTLALGSALCSNARLLAPDDAHPGWHIVGDPTEGALIVVAKKILPDLDEAEAASPRSFEMPFDAVRKRMSTVHDTRNGRIAYVKGAPKELLGLCTSIATADGVVPIDDDMRAVALEMNDRYASQGLRVLAVATRPVDSHLGRYEAAEVEKDLTFLGLVAMMDPPRPEVSDVVAQCRTAGIRIIMITGDYGLTAESIARRVGIVTEPAPLIVTGAELEAMDAPALHRVLAGGEVLFARVSPEHKMRIATTLQDLGHVVAMTGDGVNDAPALKAADIGVAMGATGTDVAREAADMVLADDNFASIVHAVEEGRGVFDNIRRFVTYIFTSNIPEIVPFILFVMLRIPLPLTVLQILAIDLGTDIVPALALGVEKPEPGVMTRPPRKLTERLLSRKVLARAYFFLGPIQAAACMGAYYFAYWSSGWRPGQVMPGKGTAIYALATTMTFGAVVFTQIGNGFAQRTTRESIFRVGFTSNKLLLVGIVTEVALLAVLVYTPAMRDIFGFAPLQLRDWVLLALLSPTLLIADEIRKFVVRRMHPRSTPTGHIQGQERVA